jgi:hypothetical protein
VRALNRNPEAARETSGRADLDWVQGDAMVEAEVVAAGRGCELVVHGANPPAYRNWAGLQLPMLASSIAAAKAAGARLVFPGTVYNYGPDAFPLTEASPQHPPPARARSGADGAALGGAADACGADRPGGDFFGPKPSNSWLAGPGEAGPADVLSGRAGSATAGLSGRLGETMVRLRSSDLGLRGLPHARPATDRPELVAASPSQGANSRSAVALARAAPWRPSTRPCARCWRCGTCGEPVLLDNTKLTARLGCAEPHTPIDVKLRAALIGMNALPQETTVLAA